jgi:hypothetical protein
MWGAGTLTTRERLRNELALEGSSQDESSSAGGVNVAAGEEDEFAQLFEAESIYAPSPAVIVAPVLDPVLLAGAEAPLPFTGPKNVLHPQFRDVQRPLVQNAKRRPPGRQSQHGQIGPVGRRGMLVIHDRAPLTAGSAMAAQQDGDAPRTLSNAQRRKKRRRAAFVRFAKRPRQ